MDYANIPENDLQPSGCFVHITQSLREKHKAITYNRSDCNYLTTEQFGEAPATLEAIATALPELASTYASADRTRKGRAFDDSKVSAHTAIIPTTTLRSPPP